ALLAIVLIALPAGGQEQAPPFETLVSTGHRSAVTQVSLAQQGTIAVSADGTQIKLWDVATGHLLGNIAGAKVAVSADGRRVLVVGPKGTVNFWDTVTARSWQAFQDDVPSVVALAFTPQGARVVASSGTSLELWDADNGRRLQTFERHPGSRDG